MDQEKSVLLINPGINETPDELMIKTRLRHAHYKQVHASFMLVRFVTSFMKIIKSWKILKSKNFKNLIQSFCLKNFQCKN
jgi:hypothetical protein